MIRPRYFTALLGWVAAVSIAHAHPPAPGGTAGKLIAHYQMQQVPEEGPWFGLTYSSEESLSGAALPSRYAGREHRLGSAIVLVETPRDFSAMHRLQTDEVWHFYGGAPIDMLLLDPDGRCRKVTLGPNALAGEFPQFTVLHGVWQGSAPRGMAAGTYSFAGDQLSPAFDAADFEMGFRDELVRAYPQCAHDIVRLTRPDYVIRSSR
jgi:predicted cupin superfamily sugar epimerase